MDRQPTAKAISQSSTVSILLFCAMSVMRLIIGSLAGWPACSSE